MEKFPHLKPSLLRSLDNYRVTTYRIPGPPGLSALTPLECKQYAAQLRAAETFLVDPSVDVNVTGMTEEVLASANAMIECNVFKLPCAVCHFECKMHMNDSSGKPGVDLDTIVLAYQNGSKIEYSMLARPSIGGAHKDWLLMPTMWNIDTNDEFDWDTFIPSVDFDGKKRSVAIYESDTSLWERMARCGAGVIVNMIVWLATSSIPRGRYANGTTILKDRPEPKHTYTIVEVGALVEAGYASRVSASPAERQKVRLHLRRGHVRNQPYGPGRTLSKKIYVEAHLVGYEEQGVIVHDYKVR